jgi:hypothetical protein
VSIEQHIYNLLQLFRFRFRHLVSATLIVDTCSACSAIRPSLRQSAFSGRRSSPSAYG